MNRGPGRVKKDRAGVVKVVFKQKRPIKSGVYLIFVHGCCI